MDTLSLFNHAMEYIEAHLADDIDFRTVARLACCSEYHFRRMFASLAGISLSDYIRRRRLSQAALELRQTDARVIDVAVSYGYASADAFARAFYALHGVTPSEARLNGTPMKVIPPLTFQLTVRGGTMMDYRIIDKDAFYIVGVQQRVRLVYRGVNQEIADLTRRLTDADFEALAGLNDAEPRGVLNASINFTEDRAEGSLFDHYVGVATTRRPADARWAVLAVPASQWVVFSSRGTFPDALQDVWGRIYAEWFASSGYEVSPGPEMLWHEHDDFAAPDFHSEIWIPVMRRSATA